MADNLSIRWMANVFRQKDPCRWCRNG